MTARITAIVLTKNEERAIVDCLRSLAFCEQVLVVDSGSTDATAELASSAGAEVVNFVWNGRYPKKKQWALELPAIRNSWVLFVDADERPTPALAEELTRFVSDRALANNYTAGDVFLNYHFAGQPLRYGHQVSKRALVKRGACRFPVIDDLAVENMWEVEGHYQPLTDGNVRVLAGRMDHLDPDPLFSYFSRHNRYSDWEAHLQSDPTSRAQVRNARSAQGRIFDRVPLKPLAFFLYAFVLKQGYRDGRAGFDYAVAHAFYFWQTSLKARELQAAQADRPPAA